MNEDTRAVFLSPASQDAEIARRLADALRAQGLEVWFDQSELRGGDAWDASIRKRIKDCMLFVPVISKNTESRSEDYFRLEWKRAVDRSHLISDDHAFLVPVVIDETSDALARVPDRFRERQWSRLTGDAAGVVAPTKSLDAYTMYLKGRFHFNKFSAVGLRKACDLFQNALLQDPGFARASAGIADVWCDLADDWVPPDDAYPRAKSAAERALQRDPELADAMISIGKVLCWHEWKLADGVRHVERAVALSLLGGLMLMAGSGAQAALPDAPREDITFVAEHAGEAAQDMRYFALAWPAEPLIPGPWTAGVAAGVGQADADLLEVRGNLFSAHAFRALSASNGVAVQGFYDRFGLGGQGEQVLSASSVPGVPLDLPERIQVTNVRGNVSHYGVGVAWLHEFSAVPERGWCLVAGALVERLELDGFALDYELLGGRDAGARGLIDYSGSSTFITPYLGVLRRLPLGRRFLLTPRFAAGVPLPPGDFNTRLTGPGFDLSSQDQGGSPGRIGDGFVAFGAGLLHRSSGLELDIGSTLAYPLFEKTTHDGVDHSLLVVLSWTWPGR